MTKLLGPVMSLDASGSLGGALVFSKWKGRNYARSLVTPANPRTGPQTGIRAMFRFLAQAWASIDAPGQATWEEIAESLNVAPFHAYMRANMSGWGSLHPPIVETPQPISPDAPTVLVANVPIGGIREIVVTLQADTDTKQWGVIIADGTTGYTPGISNVLRVEPLASEEIKIVRLAPLAAGHHFLRFASINHEGGALSWTAQEDITVT